MDPGETDAAEAAEAAELTEVAAWLRAAATVTVLTGAGISTDSGIPDFRGPQGIWTRDPASQRFSDIDAYRSDPDLRRQSWRHRLDHPAWAAAPNAGHRALVDLERSGRLLALVTQNIDGLHQRAGTDPDRVLELHGTIFATECLDCADRQPMADVLDRVRGGEPDPQCLRCGGVLKSATVSFGQSLDPAVLAAARTAATSADLLLVVGSSLTVQPAAGLVPAAAAAGVPTVIVNAQRTPYDRIATAVLRRPIGTVLPALVADLPSRPRPA